MPKSVFMGLGKIFSRGGTRGFFQNFSRVGPKVVKFVFSHSKLRKPFLLKRSKCKRDKTPLLSLPTPITVFKYAVI